MNSTPKPTCQRCKGDGLDPADYQPTEWELVNIDPRPCMDCKGSGVDNPHEEADWWERR